MKGKLVAFWQCILALTTLFGVAGLSIINAAANGGTVFSPAGRTSIAVHASAFRDCADVCPEMVAINPGSYQMGSTAEEEVRENVFPLGRAYPTPNHLVQIGHRFALGKYDVTRGEYAAFVHDTGYHALANCTGYAVQERFNQTPSGFDWRNPGFPQTDRDPVVCVNWDDIHAYMVWLSERTHHHYRLPNEAEWEYAVRAGTSTLRYWGDSLADACHQANVEDLTYLRSKKIQPSMVDHFDCSDGYVYTSPVGSFRPNGFGLYDAFGDVEQFVEDCWNYNYSGAPSNGTAWLTGDCVLRVTRGGSFRSPPKLVRAAYRSNLPNFIRSDNVGFRVAKDL